MIKGISHQSLTDDDKCKVLDAVNMIELKRDGKMKDRSCANRFRQRSYLTEYESVASLKISFEGMMVMLLIDVHERRGHMFLMFLETFYRQIWQKTN